MTSRMFNRNRLSNKPHVRDSRTGLSLIEVIACTALVAVMLVPLAAVIRSSGQSIAAAHGDVSTEAQLRRNTRWLHSLMRDGNVVSVRSRRLQIRLDSGDVATIRLRRRNLEFDDGTGVVVIAEELDAANFAALRQNDPSRKLIGISTSLQARDTNTGRRVTVNSTIAIPPQIQ